MDIPVFHLDYLNNRWLIAVIAVLHVIINHGMAVGGIPLVVYLEWRGLREPAWEERAHRLLSVFFILTTTVGALTGVGIWFSAALVNPYAIGSLIRVFFWAWFTEWLVFVTEVLLILYYYLTWGHWKGARKRRHVKLGFVLAVASWLTMAVIVSILGFMMDPGSWLRERSLLSGVLNPLYFPQLAFRTPIAMLLAGTLAWIVLLWSKHEGPDGRREVIATVGRWVLAWAPLALAGGAWYAARVPEAMKPALPVALLTQALEGWSASALRVLAAGGAAVVALAAVASARPQLLGRRLLAVPFVVGVLLLGVFERVREFVRKPYAIAGYLYSNGLRAQDYPLLERDGVLAHATYTGVRQVTPDNELEAGREVFNLACTRCHTVDGINGIRAALSGLYGASARWEADSIAGYLSAMHNARPYMPPFPGNAAERQALGLYLARLQSARDSIEGAQASGAVSLPRPARMSDGSLSLASSNADAISR